MKNFYLLGVFSLFFISTPLLAKDEGISTAHCNNATLSLVMGYPNSTLTITKFEGGWKFNE